MSEFTKKTEKEIETTLAEKRKALFDFRIALSGGKAKNMKEGGMIKKTIAQALTELSLRKMSNK
ncbi:MAG: 50S ribosomal protein L29 [Patescibacteria group bacterium]